MVVQICVGSSCHLKGSEKIVKLFEAAIAENRLDNDISLVGCFCTGKCNRIGVTITVDEDVYTGITPDNFTALFEDKVLKKIHSERA